MPGPKTYHQIERLAEHEVKQPPLARRIVEKAVERLASGASIVGNPLQWLIDIFNARSLYFAGSAGAPAPPGGLYGVAKRIPKKRSDADYDVTYMNDSEATQFGSVSMYDIFESAPTFWGLGGEYAPGANMDPAPDLSQYHPAPGSTSPTSDPAFQAIPDKFNNFSETHPFITGSTRYDPFPYPEYPNYFWADLRHVSTMYHFYSRRIIGPITGTAIVRSILTSTSAGEAKGEQQPIIPRVSIPNSSQQVPNRYVWFELHASLDGGQTWEGPYDQESFMLPGYGGDSGNVLPQSGRSYYYRQHGESDLLSGFGGSAFDASAGYVSNIDVFFQVGRIRHKFRVNDVLMKFVLRGTNADEMVYIGHYGVRAFSGLRPGDERPLQGRP